ncbi:MAG TPA: MBL fold metallo-hydrolase [Gaiellaceae bacterium]|nr:MBL fold metallo-hydrolase [Gaiellaceae bacterium]
MRLTVVGCSPAWPNAGGAHSGYLLEGRGALLLDCGPGVLARLRAGGGWPELDAIAITHFHLDHWGDLVPWVWGALYLDGRRSAPAAPELWVPAGGRGRLERLGELLGFPDMFERVFGLHEYEPGRPFEAAGYTVTAVRVPHYRVEAYALRVTDGSRALAYSGDSAPSDALVELARGADLFLCEATLAAGELDGDPRGHLSVDEAAAAFRASGAARLLVTHRPSELPAGPGVELAYDGLVCEV